MLLPPLLAFPLRAGYEEAFFYSSKEYQSWVLSHCLVHLGLPDEVTIAGVLEHTLPSVSLSAQRLQG